MKQGTLAIGKDNAINAGSRLIVGQSRSGTTPAVNGTFAMGTYNQTFAGVRLNSGSITATSPNGADGDSRRGVLTVSPARGESDPDGTGEFDLRSGTIEAILAGNVNVVKRSDGTTKASETPTGKAEDIGGTVRLSYTGEHLYTGATRILAGRLLMAGSNPNSILVVENDSTYDLAGRDKRFRGVRLLWGRITDSGRQEGDRTVKGSLTVNRPTDGSSGESVGEFDLRSGTVSAVLAGTGNLVKNRAVAPEGGIFREDLVTLSNSGNTYTGTTTVNNGTLAITNAGALGGANSAVRVNSAGILQLKGGNLNINRSLTLAGGTLHSLSGNNTWAGNITLRANSTIKAESALSFRMPKPAGTSLRLSGQINLGQYGLTLEAADAGAGTPVTINGRESTPRRAASSITVKRPEGSSGDAAIAIKGTGSLTKAGTGKVTLASRNSYEGQTTINAGELRIEHASALSSSSAVELADAATAQLTIARSATINNLSGGGTTGGNIVLIKGQTLTVNQTTDEVYNGAITEQDPDPAVTPAPTAGNLAKTGAGRLTLGGDSSYTGATTVREGVLAITRSNALGTGAGAVTVDDGATLELAGNNLNVNKSLTLNGQGVLDGGQRQGALRNTGAGNRWSGAITLGSDTTIHSANSIETLLTGGEIRYQQTLTLTGNITGANRNLTLAGYGHTNITGRIQTGTGKLTVAKSGLARLTLSGQSSYTGDTEVQSGELRLGRSDAINDNSRLIVSGTGTGGTFDLAGWENTFRGVLLENGRIIDTGRRLAGGTPTRGRLIVNTGNNYILKNGSVSAILAGAGGLQKDAATATAGVTTPGTVLLTAANTYSGQTSVNAGTLRITNEKALGTPDSGTNGGTTVASGATLALAPVSGNLNIAGENLTLSGTGYNNQGALRNESGTNRWAGAITLNDSATIHNAQTGTGNTLTLGNATNRLNIGRHTLTVDGAGNTLISGVIGPAMGAGTVSGGLTKKGTGKLTLGAVNQYIGHTNIMQGTLALGVHNAIHRSGYLTIGHRDERTRVVTEGIFDLGIFNQRFDDVAGLSTVTLIAGEINRTGATEPTQGVLTVNTTSVTAGVRASVVVLYSGTVNAILAGNASLVKDNVVADINTTVTLKAANTYTGATTIKKGTLRITHKDALGTPAGDSNDTNTTVEPGGTLELALTDTNTISENLTLSGRGYSRSGAFYGTLRNVSGNNTLSGEVNVGFGNASLGNVATIHNASGDSSATAPSLTLSGPLTLTYKNAAGTDLAANLTFTGPGKTLVSGQITGLGGLIKQGLGTLVLNNARERNPNNYAGGTKIKAGTLELRGGYAIPDDGAVNKGVTLSRGATLNIIDSETIGSLRDDPDDKTKGGSKVVITKDQTLTVNNASGNDTTFSGVISDTDDTVIDNANLTKKGEGKFTLAGLNTYTGATTIEAGTLALGTNEALKSRELFVKGGTFDLGKFKQTFADTSGGVTPTIRMTGGRIIATDANKGRDSEEGKLIMNTRFGGAFDLQHGTVSAKLAGTAGLAKLNRSTKADGGKVTLSGLNSYTGKTLIVAGTLQLDVKDALPTGTRLEIGSNTKSTSATLDLNKFDTTVGGLDLQKSGRINGPGHLTVDADGKTGANKDVIIRGKAGDTTALTHFTVKNARQIILTGSLTLTGRATFRDIEGKDGVAIKIEEGSAGPGSLTAKELLLRDITGSTRLVGDVDTMAADNIGALSFGDKDDLTVGTVGGVSGITTSNPLTLDVSGLLQSGPAGEAITTSSTLNLRARGIGAADTPLNLDFKGTAAGSLKVTTSGQGAAGNIYLNNAGDLKTSVLDLNTDKNTAQTVQLAARQSSGTPPGGAGPFLIVDDPGAGSSNLDANDTLVFNTAVKVNADRAITFRGALTFRGMIHAGTHRLTLTTPRLILADDVTAGALNMGGAGELVIAGNSPTLHINPVNLTFPNRMTGEGSLTIPGIQGQNLDVGRDLKLPADMRDYRGHLIIGGRLTPEGILPWYHRDVTDIRVHVPRLTVSRAIETGGPVTLLGGDLDLNADIRTGGQLGLLATGPNQPGLAGTRGLIRAGRRVRLTVPPAGVPAGRPAAAFIAVGGFRNAFDINLRLGRRELDLASSQGAVGFDPRSRFTDQTTDPDFRAFVSRLGAVLGTSGSLNLQLAQAFAFNPASRLTGIEALAFIDLSLFGQELTLFGAIGTGIALSLSQCEEQYGCAPNVTLEELDTLIEQLTARIAELERRLLTADEAERATIEAQLAGYRDELQNFVDYRETLRRYILAEEAADDLRALPEAGDADEVARLTRALQGVRARIQWLESLRADAAERERLARTTGQDLTPARLEVIIEAAKAQATFIENRIRLLLEGTEAGLPEAPAFRAEAGDYESVDVAQYGQPLGALTLGGERGWY